MAIVRLNIRSRKSVETQINNALARRVKRLFSGVRRNLTNKLKREIRNIIEESTAYQAILFSVLRGEFGLTRPKTAMDIIITEFVRGIKADVKNPQINGRVVKGELNINIDANWEKLVSLNAAQQIRTELVRRGIELGVDIESNIENFQLPWLRWLLLEGSNAIVEGYSISRKLGRGRSGLNYRMIKTPTRSYRVNTKYRGTENDNFITRELQEKSDILRKTLLAEFQKELRRVLQ